MAERIKSLKVPLPLLRRTVERTRSLKSPQLLLLHMVGPASLQLLHPLPPLLRVLLKAAVLQDRALKGAALQDRALKVASLQDRVLKVRLKVLRVLRAFLKVLRVLEALLGVTQAKAAQVACPLVLGVLEVVKEVLKDLGALEALDLGVLMAPGTLQAATVLHQMLTVVQHNKITQARAASEVVASAAVAASAVVASAVVASAVVSVAARVVDSAVAREEVSVETVQRNHFAHQVFSPTHSAARPMLVA